MGQREAIAVWLIGGGTLVPIVGLVLLAEVFGAAALPISLAVILTGVACLVVAKWRHIRSGRLVSFGPKLMRRRERSLYLLSYGLIGGGLGLALLSAIRL